MKFVVRLLLMSFCSMTPVLWFVLKLSVLQFFLSFTHFFLFFVYIFRDLFIAIDYKSKVPPCPPSPKITHELTVLFCSSTP